MELLVLILVNIVTAVVMYVVFSIRFSRAVEQARKNPIVRELKDNIQITIEFINTSLDLMDEKTKTFYQLVRRSEEITKQLEEAASPKPKPKTRKSRASKKSTAAKSPRVEDPGPPAVQASVDEILSEAALEFSGASAGVPPVSTSAPVSDVDPMERALSGLGADRLDLTPLPGDGDSAYRGGEQSAGFSRPFSGVVEQSPGRMARFFSGMAQGIRGLMNTGGETGSGASGTTADAASAGPGANPAAPTSPSSSPPPPNAPPPTSGAAFAGVLAHMEDRLEAKAKKEQRAGGSEAESREPRSMDVRDILELSSESTAGASSAGESSAHEGTESPSGLSGENLVLTIEAVLARSGLNLRDRSPGGRADRIRELLRHGFDPREISGGTGIALPEVELIASLPEGATRPRRFRGKDA